MKHAGQDVLSICDSLAKTPETIDAEVATLLRGTIDVSTGVGMMALDFRARLATALRERRLWPCEHRQRGAS